MKELVIISGKGGTGKTSITASLAALADSKVVVDCDVDAADMHLLLKPRIESVNDFYCGKILNINQDTCTKCGKCLQLCRFDAINDDYEIDEIKCEGCGVCCNFCPSSAIEIEDKLCGEWYESDTRFGKLIHAKLGIAEENSGKLVTKIRNHARVVAHRDNRDLIIVDGSPGIGCPVIASISGANLVLLVIEPTLSGLHDFERVFQLTRHFKIPACVCINKFDINVDIATKIKSFCVDNKIDIVGEIPYSSVFTEAMIKELTVVEYVQNDISKEISNMWNKLESKLNNEGVLR